MTQTTRPIHELKALWDTLHRQDKALLRDLYSTSRPVPLYERTVTPQWVRSRGYWTESRAMRRHLEVLVERGFLVADPATAFTWRPSLNPDVERLVLGKTEDSP